MTVYELPAQPISGMGVDRYGITWRRTGDDLWDPEPCPTCAGRPSGGLRWPALLEQRGPIDDVPIVKGD